MGRGLRIGSVFGIDLQLDASLLLIFGLITASLGLGVLPSWHPDWHPVLSFALAIAAAICFFLSILAHELSHALVARGFGLEVKRITLFLFGGVANIEREPPSPKAELLIAAAGPVLSLVLGVTLTLLGAALTTGATGSPREALSQAGPIATLLLWLGPVNIMLGLFNLVPGFPLDGGRVLRAVVWWGTGSLRTATRVSAGLGQLCGWALIACGVAMAFGASVPFFGTGLASGLWLMMIGWFLSNAAAASWQTMVVEETLRDVPIRRILRRKTLAVSPELSVAMLVSDYVMATDQHAFPVMENGRLAGVVSLDDVRKVPRDAWERSTVRHIMSDALESIDSEMDAADALRTLARTSREQIPVVHDGRLEGVLTRDDLLKWIALQEAPATRE